jgi:hypothetical protein
VRAEAFSSQRLITDLTRGIVVDKYFQVDAG